MTQKVGGNTQSGIVNYNKIDFELSRGFHTFSTLEFQKSDLDKNETLNKFFGFGVQYFPRPHFEFSLTLQRQIFALMPGSTDLAFALFHHLF